MLDYLLARCSAWLHCVWHHGIEPMTISDDIGPTSVRCSVCGRHFWRREEDNGLDPAPVPSRHLARLASARVYTQAIAERTATARREVANWTRQILKHTTYACDQARQRLGSFRTSGRPRGSDLATHLDRIQQLTDALAKVQGDAVEQQKLAECIHREIVAAKLALQPPLGVAVPKVPSTNYAPVSLRRRSDRSRVG